MSTPPYPGGEQERRHGAEPPYPEPRPAGLDPAAHAALGDPLVAVSFSDWWSKVVAVLARSWRALLVIQLATVVPGMIIGALVTAAGQSGSTVVSIAGALLGLLRLRFDSLWPAVFGHALINSLFVWGYGMMNPAHADLDPTAFWVFNALGWLLLLVGAALVYRHRAASVAS